MKVEEKLLKC